MRELPVRGKMRKVLALFFALTFCSFSWAAKDTLFVTASANGGGMPFTSAIGVWWPELPKKVRSGVPKDLASAQVVVWFHGGMTSGNCRKGFVAGDDFSKLFPNVIVVSASACRENHWVTPTMESVIEATLDSVATRRKAPVDEVSLVGVSDGALGVLNYSMRGKRRVRDRLLVSSFGKLLGDAHAMASVPKMHEGRWFFLQGGNDRLFSSDEAVPWIKAFCSEFMANCTLWFDLSGEHDWSYWRKNHLDDIRDAIRTVK